MKFSKFKWLLPLVIAILSISLSGALSAATILTLESLTTVIGIHAAGDFDKPHPAG